MINQVKILDPKAYSQGVRKVKRVIEKQDAEIAFWKSALQFDGPRVEGIPKSCARCREAFISYSNGKANECHDCRNITKQEKADKKVLEKYGNRQCDICEEIIPLERARQQRKRCSDKCDAEWKRLRNIQTAIRLKERAEELLGPMEVRKKNQMKQRAAIRKAEGIVCGTCRGKIPDEKTLVAKYCSIKCQQKGQLK